MTLIPASLALICARACEAAYELDQAKRLVLLNAAGLVEDAYVQGAQDARALICHPLDAAPAGGRILAFQGTQASRGELPSIFANLEVDSVTRPGGAAVHDGYWTQTQDLAVALLDLRDVDIVTGHSMGGAIAHLFVNSIFPAIGTLITFGAPKCANQAFWDSATTVPSRIVNGRDPAPLWPFIPSTFVQPSPQLWLHGHDDVVLFEPTFHRPTAPDQLGDHGIDAYIARLALLTAPAPAERKAA